MCYEALIDVGGHNQENGGTAQYLGGRTGQYSGEIGRVRGNGVLQCCI